MKMKDLKFPPHLEAKAKEMFLHPAPPAVHEAYHEKKERPINDRRARFTVKIREGLQGGF